MIIATGLTPERQAQHDAERAAADHNILELARFLQRAGFCGTGRTFEPDFEPKPLYLTQATALAAESGFRHELRRLLGLLS